MNSFRSLFLWFVIIAMVILLWQAIQNGTGKDDELAFTQFLQEVDNGNIEEVTLRDGELSGKYKGSNDNADSRLGEKDDFYVQYPEYPGLVDELRKHDVQIKAEKKKESPMLAIFLTWGPVLLIVALWIFFMRQFQNGGNKALSFGKSRAKLLNATGKKVTFDDVAGIEEAKAELSEVVEFLKEPQKFQRLGGRIPKGVLLMGAPGTGKTLLARAIAGEANVPFFSISGSDFVEMFVGVGASRVRDLFEQGKKNAPCIIFIDEIDAVGRHRGAGLGGGHDEREQTLNQLLVEMDGFETNEGVILIAATNRPDVLDPALQRPGRFDRSVVVDRPDIRGRIGILRVHTKPLPLSEDVDIEVLGRGTPGLAGADLANLVNEAALIAARRDKKTVEMEDFEYAKDKVLMGVERKTMLLTDEEKKITAVHEAGHAVVAAFLEETDPLHKVTIIPRGHALGLTVSLPTEDKHGYRLKYLQDKMAMVMGGRAAEELALGDVTNGAVSDIQHVTSFARAMVCEWGLSKLGPISFNAKEEPVFIGRDYQQRQSYSEATAVRIDAEVERIVNEGLEKARKILRDNREGLDRVASELLDRESLEGYEVYQILEEVTGRELMPESLRQKLAEREEAMNREPEDPVMEAEPPADEDPGLAANSLPSPATS